MNNLRKEEIQIIGRHPHVGDRGTIDGSGMVVNGKVLLLVDLIECRHGIERCYAAPEHIGRITLTPLARKKKASR